MEIQRISVKSFILLVGIMLISFYAKSQTILAKADGNYVGVKRVEVVGRFCDVKVSGSETSDTAFKGMIEGKIRGKNDFIIKHRQDGSVLKVWIESPRSIMGRIQGHLTFKVPYDMEIDITNSSGDIYIDEIAAEKMKIKTTSGDIELKNIETQLTTTSTSGDLEINYLKGAISAASTSGGQTYSHIRASVSTRATSGDLSFSDVKGDLNTRTTSGDLQFEDIEGRISNVSTSGSLVVNKAKTILDLQATSGHISGRAIQLLANSKLKATSGHISMNFENDFDQLSFDLRASSGNLSVAKRTADQKLYLDRGEIWLLGQTSSGNQKYR